MKKHIIIAIGVLFASSTAYGAAAQVGMPQSETGEQARFSIGDDAMDSNRDGRLEESEFYEGISDAGLYSTWDRDGDGLIENNEFDDLGWDDRYGAFDDWDSDRDGYLNSGEFYDGLYGGFDENENGHWDAGEWDDAGDSGLFDV